MDIYILSVKVRLVLMTLKDKHNLWNDLYLKYIKTNAY